VTAAGRPCGSRLIRGYREDDGVLAEGRVLSVLSGTPDISVDAKDTARRHPHGAGGGRHRHRQGAFASGPAPQLFQMFIRSHRDLLAAFLLDGPGESGGRAAGESGRSRAAGSPFTAREVAQ
jgi:hypothetical protein